jgi:pimeloyl-ACP methyl ester carboxylesterase
MISRRSFILGGAATLGALSTRPMAAAQAPALPQTGYATTATGERIYYEVSGPTNAPALFLAVPVYATTRIWTDGYLSYFTDKYRVLVADFPHSGRSDGLTDFRSFTADRVVDDYLAVATAAWGPTRKFAIAGYSWGGNSSLLLATRTDRLSAVAVGGWPALQGPWATMLQISQELGSAMYTRYYETLQKWNDTRYESKLVRGIKIPRLNYVDVNDHGKTFGQSFSTSANMIELFRRNRSTLEAWGWDTAEVDGAVADEYGHTGGIRPDIACPVLRSFLDKHL